MQAHLLMGQQNNHQGNWSSGFAFILVSVGSAIGLGNLWKFPYITYENGGGEFVLIYLLAIVFIALPVMIAAIVLGKRTKLNIVGSYRKLSNNNRWWSGVGVMAILAATLILSFYSVISGWALKYFFEGMQGTLVLLTKESSGAYFQDFLSDGSAQILYHSIAMLVTGLIVAMGTKGIETAIKCMLPVLFAALIILMFASTHQYGSEQTFNFLFDFDQNQISINSAIEAVGHAFFTLSIGIGILVIYGSYLPDNVKILPSSIMVALADTAIAFIACFTMYPIIFGADMEVSNSSGILFTTLPVHLNELPFGRWLSPFLFILISFAAITSMISILEVIVSCVSEELNLPRKKTTVVMVLLVYFMGFLSALGNGANHFLTNLSFMDKADFIASNLFLPLGGISIACFVGFYLSNKEKAAVLQVSENSLTFKVWNVLIKYFAPIFIFTMMIYFF